MTLPIAILACSQDKSREGKIFSKVVWEHKKGCGSGMVVTSMFCLPSNIEKGTGKDEGALAGSKARFKSMCQRCVVLLLEEGLALFLLGSIVLISILFSAWGKATAVGF